MAIEVSKIKLQGSFDYQSEELGILQIGPLTLSVMAALEKDAKDKKIDGPSFTRSLLRHVARRRQTEGKIETDQEIEDHPLEEADVSRVSEKEIERFAREFLAHNDALTRDSKSAKTGENKRKSGKRRGKEKRKTSDIHKRKDERDSDFLLRAYRRHAEQNLVLMRKRLRELVGGVGRLHFPKSALEAFQRNVSLTQSLNDQIEKFGKTVSASGAALEAASRLSSSEGALTSADRLERFASIPPPPAEIKNPIWETNDRLDNIITQIEALVPLATTAAKLVESMNATTVEMLGHFSQFSRETRFYSFALIVVAVISTTVAAVIAWLNLEASRDAIDEYRNAIAAQQRTLEEVAEFGDVRSEKLLERLLIDQQIRSAENREQLVEALAEALRQSQNDEIENSNATSMNDEQ